MFVRTIVSAILNTPVTKQAMKLKRLRNLTGVLWLIFLVSNITEFNY